MTTDDAVSHFKSGAALARALGIHRSAIGQWGADPPIDRQCQIEVITGGALKADRELLRIAGDKPSEDAA
jgi:transcriptional repressor of cell division inhibition gene dicB